MRDNATSSDHFLETRAAQGTMACALISDHKLALAAGALATRIARLWKIDVHVFIERPAEARIPIRETREPGVSYHYEDLFSGGLDALLPDHPRFSRAAWGRLLLPSVLTGYDRILYCDIDTLPGPLPVGLASIPLPAGIGMVRDAYPYRPFAWREPPEKQFPSTMPGLTDYFNSGVLLLDRNRFDSDDVLAGLRRFMPVYGSVAQFVDQDFLNHHFAGRISELSPNLNFQQPLLGLGLAPEQAIAIRHYCYASEKPYQRLPAFGVSSLVRQAAAEFRLLHAEADLPLPTLPSYRKRQPLRDVKSTLRGLAARLGVTLPKARKLELDWHERRRRVIAELRQGHDEGTFADPWIFDLDAPAPRHRFDGVEIVAVL